MKQRHVVVVNWKDSAHPAAGGAEVFCASVARELVPLGMRVTMLASRPDGTPARSEVDGYTVRRMGGTYTVYLLALFWLLRHRRSIDAVIDSQNGIPFFTPLALRRSTSIVLLIHHVHQEQFAMYFSPFMARVGRWLESSATRRVYGDRAVVAVSPSSRREIRRLLGLQGPVYVVPNGSSPVLEAAAQRASAPTITCVGRLVSHKRWELVVELARQLRADLPHLTVNLVGSGSELDALTALVAEHGLNETVILHGYVSAAERDRLLAEAWLTVSTSVGEGWGLSIVEACAVGVPAVSLDVPGLRDSVLDGVTGWLVRDDDLAVTVLGALATLADPVIAEDYAQRCRAWSASLQWSASAERFHAIFADEAVRLGTSARRRRRETDATTIVTLDQHAARSLDLTALRPTAQTTFCELCIDDFDGPWRILLNGSDESDALNAIVRAGVNPHVHDVRLDLCRSHELLSWQAGGVGHSYYSTNGGTRCPAHVLPTELRTMVEG